MLMKYSRIKKSSELDHGQKLTGDVTQEFRLDVDFIKKVVGVNF